VLADRALDGGSLGYVWWSRLDSSVAGVVVWQFSEPLWDADASIRRHRQGAYWCV